MFRTPRAFEQLAWTVLVYGIFVIIWGAVDENTARDACLAQHYQWNGTDAVRTAGP